MADQADGESTQTSPVNMVIESLSQCDQHCHRATMVWDGYLYYRIRSGKNCSWWRCRRNRPRNKQARRCMARGIYKNQRLVITMEHSHGPESTSQNYIPAPCAETIKMDLVAAVRGFVLSADQALLQSEVTDVVKHHRCDLCGMKFAIARVLETHKMLEHRICAQWTCSECGMQFLQATCHSLHMSISHPFTSSDHETASCSILVDDKRELVVHEEQTMTPLKTNFEKQVLEPKTFVEENVIKSKASKEKEVVNRISCNNRKGVEPESQVKGKLEKSQKKHRCLYRCEYCSAEFPHPCRLKAHMRKHTGEKPYKCSLCSETFMSSSKRGAHIKTAHLKVRKHLCDWCGKKFALRKTLNEHVRTHTGEKPYSCPVCFRQFTKKNAMVVHIRQHTGEKPYVCDQCGQSFTVNVSLRVHLKSKHNVSVNTGGPIREAKPGDASAAITVQSENVEVEKQLFTNRQNGQGGRETAHMELNNVNSDIDTTGMLDNCNVFNTSFSMDGGAVSNGTSYFIP